MSERFGRTWWGQQWIAALEAIGPAASTRLDRGRYLARTGAVSEVHIEPSEISARVQDSRTHPFRVRLELEELADAVWDAGIRAMAATIRATARLLDQRMPEGIDELFIAAGHPLFATTPEITAAHCTCTDRQSPCKHVAALVYTSARMLDADPFLLFEVRGRDRRALLVGLRQARQGGELRPVTDAEPAAAIDLDGRDLRTAPGDLAAIALHPHLTDEPDALLERLGPPPGHDDIDLLVAQVTRASESAWRLAAGDGASAADDEVLVAELRAQRMATAGDVADALGWPREQATEVLDRLFGEGAIMRTGQGERARYRA